MATYHPKVKDLGKLMMDLLRFLYNDKGVEKVFSPPRIVSCRSATKIKDYIVRSKLYPVERNGVGCRGWGVRRAGGWGCSSCQVCENIKVTDTFSSFTTKRHTVKFRN